MCALTSAVSVYASHHYIVPPIISLPSLSEEVVPSPAVNPCTHAVLDLLCEQYLQQRLNLSYCL